MTYFKKRPVFLALLLGLIAVSSFAVSYSVMTSVNAPVNSSMTVIGGSCCSVDSAGLGACALDADAQTTAGKETAVDACCAVGSGVTTAAADDASQTAVASVE